MFVCSDGTPCPMSCSGSEWNECVFSLRSDKTLVVSSTMCDLRHVRNLAGEKVNRLVENRATQVCLRVLEREREG